MRISSALLVVLPFFASCPASDYWERTSPGGGGFFMDVGAGPTGIVIACSDLSGPYRSLDRGATWESIGPERGITNSHAACVAFHAVDPALVFIGSGKGLYRSENYGQTFEKVIDDGYFESVAVAPSDASIVYAAYHSQYNGCTGEVHRSNDGGLSWARVDQNLPSEHRVLKILVLPSDPDAIYVQTGKGRFSDDDCTIHRTAFRSDDGGVTFTEVGGSFANRVEDLALDPHDENGLYLSQNDADTFHKGNLYRSADRGVSWTLVDEFGGFIWPDAIEPNTLRMFQARYSYPWLPKDGIWQSQAGGAPGTWVQQSPTDAWAGGWSPAYWAFNTSSNWRAVSADPSDPGAVWWVGSQFVYASFDRGLTVQQMFTDEVGDSGAWRSRGVDNAVVVDIAISAANPQEIYAGLWDMGTFASLDGGESWIMRNDLEASGDWQGAGANTFAVEADPERSGVVWATQAGAQTGPALLLRSEDSGATWPIVGSGLPSAPLIGLSVDRNSPVNQRTLYITADGDVYASVDDGVTWELRHANGGLRFTAVDRHDADTVYAGGEGGLWRSDASGANDSWTEVGLAEMAGSVSGLPNAYLWVGVYDIEPDPVVAGRVWASVHGEGKGLYRSDDYGSSWERVLDDNHLRAVAVDPANADIVYATSSSALNAGGYTGDSNGLWRSNDGGVTWGQENAGLIWPFATTIELGPPGTEVAFLGSPGTGIHRRRTQTLSADAILVSASSGGSVGFDLAAGADHAGQPYVLVASAAGTTPGVPLGSGVTLELNYDWVLAVSLAQANTPMFTDTLGLLDAEGAASAGFNVPAGALTLLLGTELGFAYATLDPVDLASQAVRVLVTP